MTEDLFAEQGRTSCFTHNSRSTILAPSRYSHKTDSSPVTIDTFSLKPSQQPPVTPISARNQTVSIAISTDTNLLISLDLSSLGILLAIRGAGWAIF